MMYALVTGTDHGLGLSLVKELLERGFFVVACRLNPKETQVDELRDAYSNRLEIVELDIGDDNSVKAMKDRVTAIVPHIDLLINNAGILGDIVKGLGDELDYNEILHVINVNAVGTLRVTNALSSLVMNSNLKTIVNISSEAGSVKDCSRKGWFGYCMSKSATNMLSAIVHNNMREIGGRVIVIHPGHMATYMRGHLDTTAKITSDEAAEKILQLVLDTELPVEERPLYLNYLGERLPW